MSLSVSRWFAQPDLDRIAAAVEDAERKTSGEIVPYVVDHSDHYEEAEWRCGALLAVFVFAVIIVFHRFTDVWLPLDIAETTLATLVAGVAGMLAVKFIPPVKRFFAGRALMDRCIAQRAAEAFVAEEVFDTRERTGILIFVSILEHRVLVVGDSGINAKVKQNEWHDVVRRILEGIRAGKPAEGFIEGIRQCGVLLERRGVERRSNDRDELPDALRMSDR
jgi:putative membrane protein